MSSSSDASRTPARGPMLLSSPALTPESDAVLTATPEQASQPTATTDLLAAPAMPQTTILVVEDERIVGLHLKQQLVKLGYKVSAVVSSGADALRVVSERRPDVVLMDIHIDGDIDGIETAKQIKTDYTLPLIYLTAFSGEGVLQRARETKPFGYLIKPFSDRELHATIQMALERCREMQDAQDREDRLLLALGLANGARTWC